MAYRVLIAQFMHETNTFSKLKTTLEDYRKRWLIEGEEMVPRFTGTRNEVGGYIDSVKKYGWEPVWAAAANATPSGKLTKETWEHIRDLILNAAKKAGKLDAICLSLHGAAVTETEDDAEGALLEALRFPVGAVEDHDPMFLVGRPCRGQFTRVVGLVDPEALVELAQAQPACDG